ncbi:MAG: tetratricopeptide repeat protein, partial [Methylomonas sp.]
AFQELKQCEAALASFDAAVRIKPGLPEAHNNRGLALHELNQFEAALASYNQALAVKPDFAEAYNCRGLTLKALKQFEASLESYEQAIALKPDYAEAYFNFGIALQELKQFDAALASYGHALAIKPDYAETYMNLGIALQDMKQYEAAIGNYDYAIEVNPDYAEAFLNRGLALQELKQFDRALASYDRAIAVKSDFAEAYNNKGVLLHLLKQFPAALAAFDQSIAIKPDYAEAWHNRGHVFLDMLRIEPAMACYDEAIRLQPDFAGAYWDKALLKILLGEYGEGWRLYEWRWQDQQKDNVRNFAQPLWLGETDIKDKTLLIHAEQGLGDFIQFCRYASKLESLAAKVLLEAPKSLTALLSTLKNSVTILEQGQPMPDFDVHCPVMSLALACKTTLETIPADTPYLYADSEKYNIWRERLGVKPRLRIGLVWSGSTVHKNDHNRSIPLQLFAPLFAATDFEFHVLQKEIRAEDGEELKLLQNIRVHSEHLTDFTETAALAACMDLIISVDTSVAHLAGALAKPVWILLPFRPDYRWKLERTDSPWYPSATLFRQPAADDWDSVITALAEKLRVIHATGADSGAGDDACLQAALKNL